MGDDVREPEMIHRGVGAGGSNAVSDKVSVVNVKSPHRWPHERAGRSLGQLHGDLHAHHGHEVAQRGPCDAHTHAAHRVHTRVTQGPHTSDRGLYDSAAADGNSPPKKVM